MLHLPYHLITNTYNSTSHRIIHAPTIRRCLCATHTQSCLFCQGSKGGVGNWELGAQPLTTVGLSLLAAPSLSLTVLQTSQARLLQAAVIAGLDFNSNQRLLMAAQSMRPS